MSKIDEFNKKINQIKEVKKKSKSTQDAIIILEDLINEINNLHNIQKNKELNWKLIEDNYIKQMSELKTQIQTLNDELNEMWKQK